MWNFSYRTSLYFEIENKISKKMITLGFNFLAAQDIFA
jgi:hypothetical protein